MSSVFSRSFLRSMFSSSPFSRSVVCVFKAPCMYVLHVTFQSNKIQNIFTVEINKQLNQYSSECRYVLHHYSFCSNKLLLCLVSRPLIKLIAKFLSCLLQIPGCRPRDVVKISFLFAFHSPCIHICVLVYDFMCMCRCMMKFQRSCFMVWPCAHLPCENKIYKLKRSIVEFP